MHTLLRLTKNGAGSTLVEELTEYASHARGAVEVAGRMLSANDLEGARYQAVMALAGVTKDVQPGDLTIADLRFLASECADLPHFDSAPAWAIEAIDSMATRRSFPVSSVKHVLAAIRAIKGTNDRLARQADKEANMPTATPADTEMWTKVEQIGQRHGKGTEQILPLLSSHDQAVIFQAIDLVHVIDRKVPEAQERMIRGSLGRYAARKANLDEAIDAAKPRRRKAQTV